MGLDLTPYPLTLEHLKMRLFERGTRRGSLSDSDQDDGRQWVGARCITDRNLINSVFFSDKVSNRVIQYLCCM